MVKIYVKLHEQTLTDLTLVPYTVKRNVSKYKDL